MGSAGGGISTAAMHAKPSISPKTLRGMRSFLQLVTLTLTNPKTMNQAIRTKLRKLFAEQDRYEKLKAIAEHAKVGQPILLKTSRTNQIQLCDSEIASHLLAFAVGRLDYIENQLREEKV